MPSGTRAPQPPDTLRVAFEGYYGEFTWAVVHWFSIVITDPIDFADYLDVLTNLATNFHGYLMGESSDQVHLTKVRGRAVDTDGTSTYRRAWVGDLAGPISGDAESAQVAYLLDWVTADGRRGGKPRSYIPGVPTSKTETGGRLVTGTAAALTTKCGEYIAAVPGASAGGFGLLEFVDMSFVDDKAYRVTPFAWTMLGGYGSELVATQRRRIDRSR